MAKQSSKKTTPKADVKPEEGANKVKGGVKTKVVAVEPDFLEDDKLEEAPTLESQSKKAKKSQVDGKSKKPLIIVLILLILVGAGVAVWWFYFRPNTENNSALEETAEEEPKEAPKIYSKLTGLEITDAKINDLPTYCIQVPNDTYGARPQVSLNHAVIIFEAIAEGGITRLATIWQNLEDSVIGPIRSLRTYYLDWEAPFDCTLVHAGGEEEANRQASSGAYRDLTESTVYMYRESRGYSAPDNLFTSTALLTKFNSDHNYTSSSPKVFSRLTPTEAETIAKTVKENDAKAKEATEEGEATKQSENAGAKMVTKIEVNFGRMPSFNTFYQYNEKTNSYDRFYADSSKHIVYNCKAGLEKPSPKKECGEPMQLSPNVVVAMMVDEYTQADHHESIQTIGTGEAYVFQNGEAIKATWTKAAKAEQIVFKDKNGEVIKFTPGQLWIAAVPNTYGSVKY